MKRFTCTALAAAASGMGVMASSAEVVLQADLQRAAASDATAVLEDGFLELGADHDGAVGETFSAVDPASGVGVAVGATGGGFLAVRSGLGQGRGGVTALTHNDLHGDLIAARDGDGGFSVSLSGLSVGDVVTCTAFHNDANGGNPGFATVGDAVTPSIVSGAVLSSAVAGADSNLNQDVAPQPFSDADLSPSVIRFTVTASTVHLLLTTASTNSYVPVSGLVVEVDDADVPPPEPE